MAPATGRWSGPLRPQSGLLGNNIQSVLSSPKLDESISRESPYGRSPQALGTRATGRGVYSALASR